MEKLLLLIAIGLIVIDAGLVRAAKINSTHMRSNSRIIDALGLPVSFSVSQQAEGLFQLPRDAVNRPHPFPNDVYSLGQAGGFGFLTEGEIFQSSGAFLGLPPDSTNLDRLSSSLGIGSPLNLIVPPFTGPFDPSQGFLPAPGLLGTFGLQAGDNIISLSYGKDSGNVLQFSVDSNAVGLLFTDVFIQSTLIENPTPPEPFPTNPDLTGGTQPSSFGDEAAGDIFKSGQFDDFGFYIPDHIAADHVLNPAPRNSNQLYRDESELGLQAPATLGTFQGSPEDDLDAFEEADTGSLQWGVDTRFEVPGMPDPPLFDGIVDRGRFAFFSLDGGSPSLGRASMSLRANEIRNGIDIFITTVSQDDILFTTNPTSFPGVPPRSPLDFNFEVYADGIKDIGLQEGDILDALALSDVTGVIEEDPNKPSPEIGPNGILDPGIDTALFSLAVGSPTLDLLNLSPGDVFVTDFKTINLDFAGVLPEPKFKIYAGHEELGLLPDDELDALDIKPEALEIPEPTSTLSLLVLGTLGAGSVLRHSKK